MGATRRIFVVPVALVGIVLQGACGGDDSSVATDAGADTTTRVGRLASAMHGGAVTTAYPGVVAVASARSLCVASFVPQCTGTLIAPRVVLTAAHCLPAAEMTLFEVYFGNDVSSGGSYRRGTARVHASYDAASGSHAFDFGAIVLDEDAPAPPVALRTAPLTDADVGAQVTMVGFGVVGLPGMPDGLKRQGAATVSQLTAQEMRLQPAPAITCSGDSGGPILLADPQGNAQLVGVTSWGDPACQSFSAAGRVDLVLADFVQPILNEAANATPPRAPIADGSNLCVPAAAPSSCSTSADCAIGTLCAPEPGGARKVCQISGFGGGMVGAACAVGDECPYCVRFGPTAGADPECRCVRSCTSGPDAGGIDGGGAGGSGSHGCGLVAVAPRPSTGTLALLGLGVILWLGRRARGARSSDRRATTSP